MSRVLRLIPCCSYYWPLLRHCDMNGCLSAIRSINWIQRNVIQYSLQASRCWGFCKLNSFIMLMPLFCQMHHFHLSGVEKSSDGFGFFNKRWLTFNEMRHVTAKEKKTFQWQVASDNHNTKVLWAIRGSRYKFGTWLFFFFTFSWVNCPWLCCLAQHKPKRLWCSADVVWCFWLASFLS